MISVGLHGGGKMAKAIFTSASDLPDCRIAAIVSRTTVPWSNQVPQFDQVEKCDVNLDVLIDFSLPEGTRAAAGWCQHSGVALLSGTTGLGDAEQAAVELTAQSVPVLHAANLSTGVAIVKYLVEELSRLSGSEVAVEIEDTHHIHKKDAPSGTALLLGDSIRSIRGPGQITYNSVREGDDIGKHKVRFKLANEDIEIIHQSWDRKIYASGALQAAHWLVGQEPGMYAMSDVLNFHTDESQQ